MSNFNNIIPRIRSRAVRLIGDYLCLSPKISKYQKISDQESRKILLLGVVLEDRKNHYRHISSIFDRSKYHDVQQVWAVLKYGKKLAEHKKLTHVYVDGLVPRSKLINSLLNDYAHDEYDYVIIVDDDIRLPLDFLDQFIYLQERFDFSLAQPSRTPGSIISHEITRQRKDLLARQTLFVEIGPLVSIRHDVQKYLLPLDEETPMGWGLDYIWPSILLDNHKTMGLIDAVPVAHTLRPIGKSYKSDKAREQMYEYLSTREHLQVNDAHVILKEYTAIP